MSDTNVIANTHFVSKQALLDNMNIILEAMTGQEHTRLLDSQLNIVVQVMSILNGIDSGSISAADWRNAIETTRIQCKLDYPELMVDHAAASDMASLEAAIQRAFLDAAEKPVHCLTGTNPEKSSPITALSSRGAKPEKLLVMCQTIRAAMQEGDEQPKPVIAIAALEIIERRLVDDFINEHKILVVSQDEWKQLFNSAIQLSERTTVIPEEPEATGRDDVKTLNVLAVRDLLFEGATTPHSSPTTECFDAQPPENLCESRAEALIK